jgi:hypothetical protein
MVRDYAFLLWKVTKNGEIVSHLRWKNVIPFGLDISKTGIYLSGAVADTAILPPFTVTPIVADETFFLGKLNNSFVGIKEQQHSFATAFPNPFKDQCTIHLPENVSDALTINLYDVVGVKRSLTSNISKNLVTINRENLPSGIFFCRITDSESRVVYTSKLVIE